MKKLLIIFPNEWLAYTPTVLNLVDKLADSFNVRVVAIDDGSYKSSELIGEEFDFIKVNSIIIKLTGLINKVLGNAKFYQLVKLTLLFNKIRNYKADEVIAVDSMGLFLSQAIFKKCHFLSLEPYKDIYFRFCKTEQIKSVIAQTQERYDYLFENLSLKTFIIQNAPCFKTKNRTYQEPQCRKAIYFGNANPRNGVYLCIEAIQNIKDMSLTIKGTISKEVREVIETRYSELIQSSKIVIDSSYVKQEDVINYLSKFYVGFCFYDLNYTDETTSFNFISVPSGKLFNYYAAGVPVIGSDLLGLKSVKDFQVGILLKNISTENIALAMESIASQHKRFSENCLAAAAYFDFDTAVEPFKSYLLNER